MRKNNLKNNILYDIFPDLKGNLYFFCENKPCKIETNQLENFLLTNIEKRPLYYFPGQLIDKEKNNNKDNIKALQCIYIDIDNEKDSIPREETLDALNSFDFPPSIIVDSGRGTHAYWLLEKPEESKEQISNIYKLAKIFTKKFNGDESVTAHGHLLRVPGSYNEKVNPPKKSLIKCNNQTNYDLAMLLNTFSKEIKELEKTTAQEISIMENKKYIKKEIMYVDCKSEDQILEVYNKCVFLKSCYDNRMTLSLEDWKKQLWFLVNQGDIGKKIAYEYSKEYPQFDENQFNQLVNYIKENKLKPYSCEKIRIETDNQYCSRCTLSKKIKSINHIFSCPSYEFFESLSSNYALTENSNAANADHWLQYSNARYIYNCASNSWWSFNGKYWEIDTSRSIIQNVLKFSIELKAYAKRFIKDSEDKKKIIKKANSLENLKNITPCIDIASTSYVINDNDFDSKSDILNFQNGTLNLETGEFYEHRRRDYLTQILNFDYLPESVEMPKFNQFISWAFSNDEEFIDYVFEVIGYAFSGKMSEQIIPFFYGNGSNGKSVLVNTLQDMLSMKDNSKISYGTMLNIDAVIDKKNNSEAKHEIVKLKNKRIAFANETADTSYVNESLLKQLSSKDLVTGRQLYKDSIEFSPRHTLFIIGNVMPNIKGTDTGIWRRLKLISFENTISENNMIKNLEEEFVPEYSAIFNKIYNAYTRFKNNSYKFTKEPQKVGKCTEDFKKESNAIRRFIEEVINCKKDATVGLSELYEAYKSWCDHTGEFKLTRKKFITDFDKITTDLKLKINKQTFSNSSVKYNGITFIQDTLDELS